MIKALNTLLIGLTSGAIYSLMAIAIVLVWRSTRIVNFAQAGLALLSTYFGILIVSKVDNFWIALVLAMVIGALISAAIEILFMRTLLRHSSQGPIASIAPIIATLGLLGLIQAGIGSKWGDTGFELISPASKIGFTIGTETLFFSPLNLITIVSTFILVAIVSFIFQKTNLGLALRASAFAPEIARLAGIRVDLVRTTGWAIAGAAGAAAGMLQTPNGLGAVTPDSIEFRLLLVFGFIAAVIGGLESLIGAVVGGLVLGISLAIIQIYIGDTLVFLSAFAILLVILLVRPQGLIGQKVGRRA